MRLTDIGSMAMNGIATRLRRDAIAYSACAVCALGAIALAVSAGILALEPQVGMVYARLIVGGVLAAIAISIVLGLRHAQQPRRPAAAANLQPDAAAAPRNNAQFAQIAMLVEAVMLGYTLSRRSDRR